MRLSFVLGEPVVTMDARGNRLAAREISEQWDPEEQRHFQESWCREFRKPATGDWTTATRNDLGVMEFWRDDF